jgi:hypothetical protein
MARQEKYLLASSSDAPDKPYYFRLQAVRNPLLIKLRTATHFTKLVEVSESVITDNFFLSAHRLWCVNPLAVGKEICPTVVSNGSQI